MEGTKITYNAQQDEITQMQMYGLIRNDHNIIRVANRIFETMLYNLFLSDEELKNNVFSRAGDLYMLNFNFNKKKEVGVKQVEIGDKVLFEGTV